MRHLGLEVLKRAVVPGKKVKMNMIKCFAALALCGAVAIPSAKSDISSSNICGYQKVNIPSGAFVFTPTFKTVGTAAQIDLKTITPLLKSGLPVSKNMTVTAYVLGTDGNYQAPIFWYGGSSIWTKDGTNPIADGEVMIGNGKGIAFENTVKVNAEGVEPKKGGTPTAIDIQISGEVDLVCQNVAAPGAMIQGNSTPVACNLKDITPLLPSGLPVTKNMTVTVYMLGSDGNYLAPIFWYGSSAMWTKDGANPITDAEGALASGQGFGMENTVKINAEGVEPKKGGTPTWIYLKLPSPIK